LSFDDFYFGFRIFSHNLRCPVVIEQCKSIRYLHNREFGAGMTEIKLYLWMLWVIGHLSHLSGPRSLAASCQQDGANDKLVLTLQRYPLKRFYYKVLQSSQLRNMEPPKNLQKNFDQSEKCFFAILGLQFPTYRQI
jgi:hypothetical protein